MKLCWLIPDDRGGGVAAVALSCCRQAARVGHQATLLMVLSPTGWIRAEQGFQFASLDLGGSAKETPQALLLWLEQHPQDVLFLNGCEQADAVIPYLPSSLKCVYVVHDTAPRYWQTAVKQEDNLEAIAVVSQSVAQKFCHLLKQPTKLAVVLNGCTFPKPPSLSCPRPDDLIFLGGDNPYKGAFDLLKLWQQLVKLGFKGNLHWFGHVEPKFQARINRLLATKRVHVYGRVKRDVIFSKAASTKVILILTRTESFGMATVEAMSMGSVPVAWDIDTGTKEIITANKTGLFAPLGNTKILARQVFYVCQHYPMFSAAVIEQSRTKFDETVVWNRYAQLIDRLTQSPPIYRSKHGQPLAVYQPPKRRFQLLPASLRLSIREFVGRSPHLGYWLRDFRGF